MVLIPVLLVYVAAALGEARRRLWYDELLTWCVAGAPTWDRFWDAVLHVDLNPPLLPLLIRGSLAAFGDHALAIRLPSLCAFLAASVFLYIAVRRRAGTWFALLPVLGWWFGSYFTYSSEARPYALVLAFFGLAAVCWQAATEGPPRRAALAGVSVGFLGMIASHCLAPVSFLPFAVAEGVRWWRRRRPDWGMALAMALPLPAVLLYLPLVRRFQHILFPPDFVTSWLDVALQVLVALWGGTPAFVAAFVVALLVAWLLRPAVSEEKKPGIPLHEWTFLVTTLLMPVAVRAVIGATASWPRYSIVASMGAAILLSAFFWRFRREAIVAACLTLCLAVIVRHDVHPRRPATMLRRGRGAAPSAFERVPRDLPIVDASGLTFLEMNYYEPAELLSRVWYLNDRDLATRYAHATIFEGYPLLARYFPIRGRIGPYREFVRTNRHFLVLGTSDFPEDWVIPALRAEGASLRRLGEFETGYRDQEIYEVNLPAAPLSGGGKP